ncbi:carboxymuconolactone decarboxylase family protein [Nonomuraea sp. NPDC050556]|uniref:carboxymuconolactone decarboxylase family protein n=1 Tax=Nonomuraea sp. NPDC050556 TaxID=3364369 RepID=UPI0037B45523
MSRLPVIEPETATGAAAELLAKAQKVLGVTPNMTKAMANSPAVLSAYLEFTGALSSGSLPAAVRERLALVVAQENGCDYCLAAHTFVGIHLAGLSAQEAEAARRGSAADAKAQAALTLAVALVRGRGDVEDAELAAARLAGLSDGEIAEVVAHVALNVFTNYFTKTARPALDWPLVSHQGES